jgi:hypothetical protein
MDSRGVEIRDILIDNLQHADIKSRDFCGEALLIPPAGQLLLNGIDARA